MAFLQVNSSSEHSMVVYTPSVLDPEGGIGTFNITLPSGYFCSNVLVDPSEALPCPALPCPYAHAATAALPILVTSQSTGAARL